MTKTSLLLRSLLIGSTALTVFAAPAYAQDASAGGTGAANDSTAAPGTASTSTAASASTDATAQQQDAQANSGSVTTGNEIVVTGSITRNPAGATASPIVSVTSTDLQNRGISTIADALQLLSANNAGTAPPSWSSFGFATGASAVSLRGLDDNYTLTLFNGLRTAVYPLADDGQRNFVDINAIPASIVDKVDVLLDGASATYGSDAIAGVVNVIVKRQITGLHLNGSAALSQRHDYGERKFSATYGYGDLDSQGFNVYVNGEYQHNQGLYLRDRGYPFNSADQSRICGTAEQGCLTNGIRNGIQYDGIYNGFQSTIVPFVRPYSIGTDPETGAPVYSATGTYQAANLSAGCQGLTSVTLTDAQHSNTGGNAGATAPSVVCQQDLVNQYRTYASPTTRKGANARATVKLGADAEAWVMLNYYNTTTKNQLTPGGYTGQTAAGGTQVTANYIFLPTYVCANGVGSVSDIGAFAGAITASGCNAGNGTLNPNNPFAADGQLARLSALPSIPRETDTNAKTYRISGGINGSAGDLFNYNITGTASKVTLDIDNQGYTYLQGLLDAVATGSFNFINPLSNSDAAIQQVFPDNHNRSVSKLWQVQASLDKDLFALPGGELNVAVLGGYRYESLNNPSANAPNADNPNARYYSINAVSVVGKRHVWTAGYQITAPILDSLKAIAEGSYDKYSTGQKRFSPKFDLEFKPVEQLKLRGTWSEGFRAPNFAESFALPTTGYVGASINCDTYAAFCAAHASNPSYYAGTYNYGLTSAGNSALKPEKSKGLTGGVVLTPMRNIVLTVDYWRVKVTNQIAPVQASQALFDQYYNNNGVVNLPGVTVTQGIADPENPGALPLLGTVVGTYKNANALLARGIDFSASAKFPLFSGIQWQTVANVSYLLRLKQIEEDGSVQRYDGTLGPCNITSCSGAPKWRAIWQNTLDFNGKGNVSVTGYYTKGYSSVATDLGGVYGDCAATAAAGALVLYPNNDPVRCHIKAELNFDGHAQLQVQDHLTLYTDVLNILNNRPHYTPDAAYGLYQFNPAWADRQFVGRYFRVGAKVDF